MNIAGLDYNLSRKCLEIYIRGCKPPHCPGCHNKSLWQFDKKDNINFYKNIISKKIKTGMVDEVWLLGGEPLDQNLIELENFIKFLKTYSIKLWLWTRYENCLNVPFLKYLDFIKTGAYDKNLPEYYIEACDITLASSNQKIISLNYE